MSSAVTARLAVLVASMRAGGARVGIGDLLTAHRAPAAGDSASRPKAPLSRRAALGTRPADLELFDAAFESVFGAELPEAREAVELPDAAKLVVPRIGVPRVPGRPGRHALG